MVVTRRGHPVKWQWWQGGDILLVPQTPQRSLWSPEGGRAEGFGQRGWNPYCCFFPSSLCKLGPCGKNHLECEDMLCGLWFSSPDLFFLHHTLALMGIWSLFCCLPFFLLFIHGKYGILIKNLTAFWPQNTTLQPQNSSLFSGKIYPWVQLPFCELVFSSGVPLVSKKVHFDG